MTQHRVSPANDPEPAGLDPSDGWLARLTQLPARSRLRWTILVFWIVIVAVTAPLAARIGEVEDNGSQAFLPESSDSLQVLELQAGFETGDSIAAVIVYQRDGGLTDEDSAKIEADAQALTEMSPAFRATDPVPSENGIATLLTVVVPDTGDDQLAADVGTLRSLVSTDAPEGLQAKVTGPAGIGVDLGEVFEGINGRLLISAAIVVAILLLLTYRSPFLWVIPLLVVAFADRLANSALFGLGKAFEIPINGQSVGIMAILVFGAGTDYALLLISRYREELRSHERPATAMAVALRQAAPAIIASGGTVILGLACLLVADLNSNRSLGPAGIVGILCALVLTLTLLPALLVVTGRRVFWPFVPKFDPSHVDTTGIWTRVGSWVKRRPRPIWIGTSVLLLALSLGVVNYSVSFSQDDQFTNEPEAIQGAQLIAANFPAGAGSPTTVIVDRGATDQIPPVIAAVEGVAEVRPSSESGDLVSFAVTLSSEPGTDEAFDTIQDLRDALAGIPDANALVGGPDAQGYDTEQASTRDQNIIIPLVLLVVFVILACLLRSLLAPFLLLATTVLSTVAALGVTILVFQGLLGYDGLQAGVLLLGFVFLIALGVDYNIFLMSRVHEESPRIGTREGMLKGLAVTGGVITSAGIVLAATFAVLGILPLVALAQVGFLVSFGVLMDALLVRSILVPAITLDIGKRIWWPSRLSRDDGAPHGGGPA
ncbi:MAG: MMPL family transporter [Thermomicrobiales bacterium]